MLGKHPFYDELNIAKMSKAFKRYTRSYGVDLIDSKDPLVQLPNIRPSIKDLFKYLVPEIKSF